MALPQPSVPFRVYYEHRPNYLFVYMGSDLFNYDNAKQFWQEILPVIHHRRYRKVMIERDIPESPSPAEMFTLARELSHSGCINVRFAIVDGHCSEEAMRFEETVNTNRGLHLRTMRTFGEAEEWLAIDHIDRSPASMAVHESVSKSV